jgi:hypothetical protein
MSINKKSTSSSSSIIISNINSSSSNSSKCYSCKERSCLRIDGKDVCLLHFSLSKHAVDYTNLTKNKNKFSRDDKRCPTITDHSVLDNQKINVQDLWKEAISDVILNMFDLQQDEQDMLRKDPLAIIQLESNPINRTSFTISNEITNPNDNNDKNDILKYANKIVNQTSASGAKLKRLSFTPNEVDGDDNPYVKKRTAAKSIWQTGLSSKDKEEQLNKVKEKEAEEERLANDDPNALPCLSCSSKWTNIRLDSGNCDISKNETWGGVSAVEVKRLLHCNSCGYTGVIE